MSHIENAIALFDSRRQMGTPEGRALYSTAAGLASVMACTREQARAALVAALNARSTKTFGIGAL